MKKIEDRKLRSEVSQYLTTFLTEQRNHKLLEVLSNRTRHVTVVLEDLYQTQNISAVMRTCECYGVQDVHIVEGENKFEIHSAIAMGSNKWLTLQNYPSAAQNMKECISDLKEKGYTVVATVPAENSLFIDELPVTQPTAFLFGTELTGLSKEAIQLADQSVKIPMYGFTESYNISNSVAIIISQFVEKMRKNFKSWPLSDLEKEELYFEWLQKSVKMSDLILENYLK
ncbi:MAG: RNA methyltransferase [Bacteroidales bacterium]